MRKFLTLLFTLAISTTLFAQKAAPSLPAPAQKVINKVSDKKIRHHVKFLAHDLLEGRGSGQRGGNIAGEYIATQFALHGLKPAGENGTYLQKVPLVGGTTSPQTMLLLTPSGGQPMPLKYADEFVLNNLSLTEKESFEAPIVFVGYGIQAPEYQWDDYKGVDVKGKVVLMLVNEPTADEKLFTGKALTYYGRWTYKFEQAGRMGAAAVILIHETQMASYGWGVVKNSNTGERSYIRGDAPEVKAAGWIQFEVAKKLAQSAGTTVEAMMRAAQTRDFKPVDMKASAKIDITSKLRDMEAYNVVGMIEGSDAKLKSEAVIFSSHYDHLGIRAEAPGDNIYNGANDNATGTAMLIEMAHVLSESAVKPKRSLIFAAVTAEEQGLRGSEYMGVKPPIPAKNIVLNLNFDAINPIGEMEEVEVVGSERTSFYPVVQQTAAAFGLTIVPDSRPEAGLFYRSDHFSYARVGIPAFSVSEGVKWKGRDRAWGEAQAKDYNDKRYHQPSDEYKEEMDFTGGAKLARFGIALAWKAANGPAITWKPGDEFEAARNK